MGMSPREKPDLTKIKQSESRSWLLFSLWICASFALFLRPLIDVFRFAAHNEDVSHIFLIPVVSVGLIYFRRQSIFQRLSYDTVLGPILALVGAAVALTARWKGPASTLRESLSVYMAALVLMWTAGFVFFFGRNAAKNARFSLLFLLLAVPLPDFLLARVVYLLQRGSTEMVAALFDLIGVPYVRDGFVFYLGSVNIEVAAECSGIRSSTAVLILALLAAHLYLRSIWKQALFILSSLFIMIVKNGVRIATLTILSLYANPSFLYGRLHHEGGVLFFMLGLLLLAPILWLLGRSETSANKGVDVSGTTHA
jgi:exosortase